MVVCKMDGASEAGGGVRKLLVAFVGLSVERSCKKGEMFAKASVLISFVGTKLDDNFRERLTGVGLGALLTLGRNDGAQLGASKGSKDGSSESTIEGIKVTKFVAARCVGFRDGLSVGPRLIGLATGAAVGKFVLSCRVGGCLGGC